MAVTPRSFRLRCYAVGLVVCCLSSFVYAQTDECHHDYYYVNLGDAYSGGDNAVNIACIDENGCDSIVYVQSGCLGCFDPSCTNGVDRLETSAVLGGIVTVDGATDFTSGGISDGDLICSTGQLFVASRVGTNLVQAHEWSRASLAGTKFAYATNRGNTARCNFYSFESATVTVTVAGTAQPSFSLTPFAVSNQGTFNAENTLMSISSTANILVGCYEGSNDYTNVYPVHTGAVYGHDSKQTLGFEVDCVTLASQLPGQVPTCEDSAGNSVTPAVQTGNLYYTINANQANFYAGRGMSCTPASGNCIAITTTADNDGTEGTMWVSDAYLANFFVLPFTSQRFAIVSPPGASQCQILDGVGGSVLATLSLGGTSTVVRHVYDATSRTQGSVITCTGGDVAIISSFNQEEYNLGGRESQAVWSYAAGLSTCAPTSNPTSQPTTAAPTNQPTDQPTTAAPTDQPTDQPTTAAPTDQPTDQPTTAAPTDQPTTAAPTDQPTDQPTTAAPTDQPTDQPTTAAPTDQPTDQPTTAAPTDQPTDQPTTASPTDQPSNEPTTASPTEEPTEQPTTAAPTDQPTTAEPTSEPTTASPTTPGVTNGPTSEPSTSGPTGSPTSAPTSSPTGGPTGTPSESPTTRGPSTSPTAQPSTSPTTAIPSTSPTTPVPSTSPTTSEPTVPTESPTSAPNAPTTGSNVSEVALIASLSSLAFLLAAFGLIFFVRKRRKEQQLAERRVIKTRQASKFEMDMESFL